MVLWYVNATCCVTLILLFSFILLTLPGVSLQMTRLANIAKEVGFVNLCTVGLLPRCVMIGTLTAGQFGIFDTVMSALGASKFHFHDPNESH